MTEQHDAVKLILERLHKEGLEWYRGAKAEDAKLFESRVSAGFSIFEGNEIHTLGRKPVGSFPRKSILLMQPGAKEKDALPGLWLRWDFAADPFEYRVFLGQWSTVDGKRTFIAFRFEAPEVGDEHDYYHCQPCRNFGDKENLPDSAIVSDRFPTIPLNASNIVEATTCAVMAALGRRKMIVFFRGLFKEPAAAGNQYLLSAYSRCCKEKSVDYPFTGKSVLDQTVRA